MSSSTYSRAYLPGNTVTFDKVGNNSQRENAIDGSVATRSAYQSFPGGIAHTFKASTTSNPAQLRYVDGASPQRYSSTDIESLYDDLMWSGFDEPFAIETLMKDLSLHLPSRPTRVSLKRGRDRAARLHRRKAHKGQQPTTRRLKACARCYDAKTKCVKDGSGACQRCQRLEKTCLN